MVHRLGQKNCYCLIPRRGSIRELKLNKMEIKVIWTADRYSHSFAVQFLCILDDFLAFLDGYERKNHSCRPKDPVLAEKMDGRRSFGSNCRPKCRKDFGI